jgi:hypothetical protein
MNCGLGTLSELKTWLLADELRTDAGWDSQLTRLGQGVAASMEAYCGRKFAREVGATWECRGDRSMIVLPRYPIEELTKVEMREGVGSGWSDITSQVEDWSVLSGLVEFGSAPGSSISRLRATWTGGYWWDSSEDGSETKPVLAEALPADLKFAWLQHCRACWARYPKLGTPVNTVSQPTALVTMNWAPEVLDVLLSYRRMSLS